MSIKQKNYLHVMHGKLKSAYLADLAGNPSGYHQKLGLEPRNPVMFQAYPGMKSIGRPGK